MGGAASTAKEALSRMGAADLTMKALRHGGGGAGSATAKALAARSNGRKMERASQHGQ